MKVNYDDTWNMPCLIKTVPGSIALLMSVSEVNWTPDLHISHITIGDDIEQHIGREGERVNGPEKTIGLY